MKSKIDCAPCGHARQPNRLSNFKEPVDANFDGDALNPTEKKLDDISSAMRTRKHMNDGDVDGVGIGVPRAWTKLMPMIVIKSAYYYDYIMHVIIVIL